MKKAFILLFAVVMVSNVTSQDTVKYTVKEIRTYHDIGMKEYDDRITMPFDFNDYYIIGFGMPLEVGWEVSAPRVESPSWGANLSDVKVTVIGLVVWAYDERTKYFFVLRRGRN